MITKEQITEILNKYAGDVDRSRTEQAVHSDNFNDVADEIISKLSQPPVISSFCICTNAQIEKDSLVPVYCHNCNSYVQNFL